MLVKARNLDLPTYIQCKLFEAVVQLSYMAVKCGVFKT